MDNDYMTIAEIAEALHCSETAVRYHVSGGKLLVRTEKLRGRRARSLVSLGEVARLMGEKEDQDFVDVT